MQRGTKHKQESLQKIKGYWTVERKRIHSELMLKAWANVRLTKLPHLPGEIKESLF
jgi:hypothetical protein